MTNRRSEILIRPWLLRGTDDIDARAMGLTKHNVYRLRLLIHQNLGLRRIVSWISLVRNSLAVTFSGFYLYYIKRTCIILLDLGYSAANRPVFSPISILFSCDIICSPVLSFISGCLHGPAPNYLRQSGLCHPASQTR